MGGRAKKSLDQRCLVIQPAQIILFPQDTTGLLDNLHRNSHSRQALESGAQNFMARNDILRCGLETVALKPASYHHRAFRLIRLIPSVL
jgi:hypothetical protein